MYHRIYIEDQRGLSCGEHALNHLFQDNIFTKDYLNLLGMECEADERNFLGFDIGSKHYDEISGYYSVQVLKKALQKVGMDMIELGEDDPRAREATLRSKLHPSRKERSSQESTPYLCEKLSTK